VIELPEHASFSSLTSYSKCPKSWQLQRVVKVPQSQGWARLGGSAVHTATENYDLGKGTDPAKLFAEAFIHEIWGAYLQDSDIASWLPSGRATKEWPNRRDQEWWWHHGPIYVQRWIDWTTETPWQLATLQDGRRGVELEFKPTIGNWPVQMFIDRLYVTEDGDVVVVDIKTGDPRFTEVLQLALYAEGVHQATGIRPKYGTFWCAQTGDITGLRDLSPWTNRSLGDLVKRFYWNLAAQRFAPRVSNLCNACSVRHACLAYGGDQASTYDPDWEVEFGTTGVAA
jgi:hypothetical protein